MTRLVMSLVAVIALASAAPAIAAVPSDIATCTAQDTGSRTAACKRILEAPAGVDRKDVAAAYLTVARSLAAAGSIDEAIVFYTAARKSGAEPAKVALGKAQAFAARQEWAPALQEMDAAIEASPKGPGSTNLHLQRAAIAYASGDADRAIADATDAITLEPRSLGAFYYRGIYKFAKGDQNGAIADFDEAARHDPKNIGSRLDRGIVKFYMGRLNEAKQDFMGLAAQAPEYRYSALWISLTEHRRPDAKPMSKEEAAFLIKTTRNDPCNASFYGAELAVATADKPSSVKNYLQAVKVCPRDSIEWIAANAVLKKDDLLH